MTSWRGDKLACVQQTRNWVIGSPGQWVIWVIFHVRVTGSSFWPDVRPEFFRFSKNAQNAKKYIWNAETTKVIVRCLLLDWDHWMSVHAMNFHFYLWLLKILWPENTSSHISRHLEFVIEQGHRVNWVSGSLDSRVTGSLGHKMWPSSISGVQKNTLRWSVDPNTRMGMAMLPFVRLLWPPVKLLWNLFLFVCAGCVVALLISVIVCIVFVR